MQWLWLLFSKSGQTPTDPLARSYTYDGSPGKGAAAGENADVARPGCFAASTVPRGNGRVPGDGEWGGVSGVWRLVMNVLLLVKASRIKYFLSTTADCGR